MSIYTGLTAITAVLVSLLLTACSNSQVEVKQAIAPPPDCAFPDSPTASAPAWVCDASVAGVELSAVGMAVKTAAGHSFMKNMAATDARVHLIEAMKVHVRNRVKQYAEATGAADSDTVDKLNIAVKKRVTDDTLAAANIIKMSTSPKSNLYVLLTMDPAAVATATENVLKTSMDKDSELWQPFNAQQNKDELASSIANMKQ